MSCFSHGNQVEESYSSCGLIIVLYICSFTDVGAFLMFQRIIPRVELALAVTSSICLDHRKLDCRTTPSTYNDQLNSEWNCEVDSHIELYTL